MGDPRWEIETGTRQETKTENSRQEIGAGDSGREIRARYLKWETGVGDLR